MTDYVGVKPCDLCGAPETPIKFSGELQKRIPPAICGDCKATIVKEAEDND